jgi:hypothetical protein
LVKASTRFSDEYPICLCQENIEKKINIDKAYPQGTPMIVYVLERDKDSFRTKQEGEDVLGAKYPYLSDIGALMYLANNTRPDIAFMVNCLTRHNAAPTMHHWNDVKIIL